MMIAHSRGDGIIAVNIYLTPRGGRGGGGGGSKGGRGSVGKYLGRLPWPHQCQ